ncbi:MAG: hypothetical protein DHS20C08_01920 [Rhodomicrobium sp.]|nr:MAG: hypothetical protein DHS20C08_01920 [Rhodomicrobium sp.]
MYLFRLIYYSVNTVQELEGSLQQELKSILLASQRNNPPLGVSGALVFNYNYFAQVLEGDRKAVTEVFCKLTKDPRHSDIVILEASPIDTRMFEKWNMGFAGSAVCETTLRQFGTSVNFHPEKMSAGSLLGFMRAVIDNSQNISALKAS